MEEEIIKLVPINIALISGVVICDFITKSINRDTSRSIFWLTFGYWAFYFNWYVK